MRASRGGRGRGSHGRSADQRTAPGGSPGKQHTPPPPAPQALPPEAEQELTKEQAVAAEERRREQEAEQMMLMSQATSQYVSQQRAVDREEEAQGGARFVRSTPSSEMESLCSHMARALEFGLTRSEQLRMPAHLLETVYGREAVSQRQPRPSSSPASPKKSASSATENVDSLASRQETITSSAPSPPSHPAKLHTSELMEPALEVSSASSNSDSGSRYSQPVSAAAAMTTTTQSLNLNRTASVQEKADDAVDALLSMNNEAEDVDGEVDALLVGDAPSTDYAPLPPNSVVAAGTSSSVDAVDGNDFHGEFSIAESSASELVTTTDTHDDDEEERTMDTSTNSVLPKAAGQRTGGAAELLWTAAASPPHYMEPTVSSVLKAHEMPPKSPPSGDSMERWLDDLLANGENGDEDDAA